MKKLFSIWDGHANPFSESQINRGGKYKKVTMTNNKEKGKAKIGRLDCHLQYEIPV